MTDDDARSVSDPAPVPDEPTMLDDGGVTEPATPPGAPRRRRPFGLLVLAALLVLKAIILVTVVVGSVAQLPQLREALRLPRLVPGLRESPIAVAVILLIAGLLVLSASGLLAGRRAGWLLAMVLTGAFIAIDIAAFLDGSANHLWMILNIVTVLYLNQAEVRAQFAVGDALEPDEPEPGLAS